MIESAIAVSIYGLAEFLKMAVPLRKNSRVDARQQENAVQQEILDWNHPTELIAGQVRERQLAIVRNPEVVLRKSQDRLELRLFGDFCVV